MLYRRPRVGQEINAYCGKCKLERTHIIAAMDGETVRRVTCSMCGGNHLYRDKPATSATTRAASPARAGGASRKAAAPAFTVDPKKPVKTYGMSAAFATGDVINHAKFGLGVVENVLPPNKIEVRFQEGKKILLHNMKS